MCGFIDMFQQEGTEKLQPVNDCWCQICWYFEWPDSRSAQYNQDSVYTADSSSSSSHWGSSVGDISVDWLNSVHSCRKSSSFPLSLLAVWCLPQNNQTHNKYLLTGLDSIVKWGRLLTISWKMKSWFIFQMNYRLLWNALCSSIEPFPLLCVLLTRPNKAFQCLYVHYLHRLLTMDSWRISWFL